MKKIFSLFLIALFALPSLQAEDIKDFSIGPTILYKAGISAINTPKGRKNGVAFNKIPDFGISTYLPLSKTSNLGIATEIAYSSYSYLMKSAHNSTEYQFNHSFVTINPNFYFGGFIIGASIGIPMSSDYDGNEIKTKTQNIMAEVKIGGMIPIFKDASGELNVFILGGYGLSGVYDDFVKNDPMSGLLPTDETVTKIFNPRAASLGLGFNFLFNWKKKEVFEDTEDIY